MPNKCLYQSVLIFISRQYFSSGGTDGPNGKNLALLLHSYVQRTDLNLAREIATNGKELLGASRALKTPVLNMTGDHSPHVEATVAFNGRLQPNRCTWMKIQVCNIRGCGRGKGVPTYL